jgi:hypothetical protein
MDAIVLTNPREILYRARGEHGFALGVDRVESVIEECMPPPAPARRVLVENLCGSFAARFTKGGHDVVTHRPLALFGGADEMYHLDGTVCIYPRSVQFKGCKGVDGIHRLADAIGLPDRACVVHMGVFCLALGRLLHTSHGCYFENRLHARFSSLRVCSRMLDMNTLVKLRIDDFDRAEMPFFAQDAAPKKVDLSVSGTGLVVIHATWARCPWTPEVEAQFLLFCDWLGDALRDCC